MGGFAGSGNSTAMRRGLGHYIRSGYGGSNTAVRRFGGTAAAASALYGALSGGAQAQLREAGSPLDSRIQSEHAADEVIDVVIEIVRPIDGTQDAEAGRPAVGDALSELLARFPDADLLNLTEEQKAFAIERYVALDVFQRLSLDLGKALCEKAPSAVTALSRLKQIKDYVKETVAASFRKIRDSGRTMTANSISSVVRLALTDTFQVFEGYAE
ncbi:MAG TPA: Qat anti-phage system associated protein QatB [Burkholderiaceae bacterium]|nr:Qat anti-phage system associated protein QatB [Burkholderiaceae bacterium]